MLARFGGSALLQVAGVVLFVGAGLGQGNALHFDGVDDSATTSPMAVGDSVTIESWVRPSSYPTPAATSAQIHNGHGQSFPAGGPHTVLEILPTGQVRGRMYNGTTSVGIVVGTAVPLGVWSHLAYVYDYASNRAELFVNGSSAGIASAPDPLAHTSPQWIGCHYTGVAFFHGALDEFRVWSVARSAGDVQSQMSCSLTGNEPSLAVYYDFNQGIPSGNNPGVNTIVDQSVQSLDATMANFALNGGSSNWIASTSPIGGSCCPAPLNYCTAGTTTNGCTATMSASGSPSVAASSGFTLSANNVEGQKTGLVFYGISGPKASVWAPGSTSYLCVKSPVQRIPSQGSGGTSNACDGTISDDVLAYFAAHPGALGQPLTAGTVCNAQCWFRDPPAPGTTNLSDGIQWTFCP